MSVISKIKAVAKYVRYNGKITQLTLCQINRGGCLQGKKIVVTGGGSGIGLAMAKKFLSEGAEVVITGRNIEKLKEAESSISNPNLHILQWDIAKTDEINEKLKKAIDMMGSINAFVNNAAFLDRKQTNEEFYDKTLDTNLRAVYFICQQVVSALVKMNGDTGGKILNISSINGCMSSTHPYYISKWGLNGLTKGFAKEYASKNIIVNAIAPGYCSSSINYQDIEENAYSPKNPIRRIIVPEDIAELASFLLSDAANAIVGQIITVDGGTTL